MLLKIIVTILLVIGIINPKIPWMLKEGWKFKDAEPSGLYIAMTRIYSVILLFVVWLID